MPRPTPLAAFLAAAPTASATAALAVSTGGSAAAAAAPPPRGTRRVPEPAGVPLTLAGLVFLVLATRRAAVHTAAARSRGERDDAGQPVALEGW